MEEQSEKIVMQTTVDGKRGASEPLTGEAGDDYDPHLHRNNPKATTNCETLIHLLKCSLGTGILAMPQAFSKAGMVTSVISIILVGILCTYCLLLLVNTQYFLCKAKRVPLLTYPESMEAALQRGPVFMRGLARKSNIIVDIFIIVYQLGIGCVYIVFIATNTKKMLDPYFTLHVAIYMLIFLFPLIGLNCIKNLKVLAPFSNVANILIFVGLGIILYFLLSGKKNEAPIDLWGSAIEFPLFFGTMLFALTAVGVVVALENNMQNPKSFGGPFGILSMGMATIVVLYIIIGVTGYMFCVDKCKDSITLNLPEGDPMATVVMALFVLAIFISYGLHCYVPVDIVWRTYVQPKVTSHMVAWEYVVRIGLCLLTFVFAVAIPKLGLFISLFGAMCLSALGLIFPAIMNICVCYPNSFGTAKMYLWKDICIILVGIVGLVAGTYTALNAIVLSFIEGK